MITELITHLQSSPVAGLPIADIRDDDKYPFNNLTTTPILIREQAGNVDRDISSVGYNIFLATAGNATPAQRGAIMTLARELQNWLVLNEKHGRMYAINVIGSVAGPYRDGQNRYIAAINITVRRNLGG